MIIIRSAAVIAEVAVTRQDGGSMETTEATTPADPALRPKPQMTRDNVWWFEALRDHRLLIQRCGNCSVLRHPPLPMCPHCHSLQWDTTEAAGPGVVHSFVVSHHPRMPGFDYPLAIALVELAEGTRVLANIVGCPPEHVSIGMDVELEFLDLDEQRSVPQFRPLGGA
jgi:uncharacterized OB-fold protein